MAKRDRKQQGKQAGKGPLHEGVVIRSTGSRCTVRLANGNLHSCVVRGKFRIAGMTTTNPVAVGDKVRIALAKEEGLAVVREILPRKNYLLRRAIIHAHKAHMLAANIDQAVVLFTLTEPLTRPGFVDRFLVIAEAYHIPAVVVFNKIDLYSEKDLQDQLQEFMEVYRSIGYEVLALSALDVKYQGLVKRLLQDKVSFIGGHSGAGKSALINLIDPDLQLKTGEISTYSHKGRHTTTYAEMFPLADGGYIIDSPGIKELGLTGFKREELSHYFPEMRALLNNCRFNDCTHIQEPGCAIRAALETGKIAPSRYRSYLSMMEDIDSLNPY